MSFRFLATSFFVSAMLSLPALADDQSTQSVSIKSIQRISVSASGKQGTSNSWQVAVSPDGKYVAFDSWASELVSGDTNGFADVFLKNLDTGAITRISVSSKGKQGNGKSFDPSFSYDGKKVLFESNASNLVTGDTNDRYDLFVYDISSKVVTRLSTTNSGNQANNDSFVGSFSPDGKKIAFQSYASNLEHVRLNPVHIQPLRRSGRIGRE